MIVPSHKNAINLRTAFGEKNAPKKISLQGVSLKKRHPYGFPGQVRKKSKDF